MQKMYILPDKITLTSKQYANQFHLTNIYLSSRMQNKMYDTTKKKQQKPNIFLLEIVV